MTNGREVIRVAETQLGITESPFGSNRGPVEKYQRPWGSWMIGEPWCGAFLSWCFNEASVPDSGLLSPSTDVICARANALGGLGAGSVAPPGSLLIRCGIHVELLVLDRGNGVLDTIGGNVSNGVRRLSRYKPEWRIIVPPGITEGGEPEPPRFRDSYGFDDLELRPKLYGGWATKADRDHWQRRFRAAHPKWWTRAVRVLRPSPYAFEAGPEGTYEAVWSFGGWATKDIRGSKIADYTDMVEHKNIRLWSKRVPVARDDPGDSLV